MKEVKHASDTVTVSFAFCKLSLQKYKIRRSGWWPVWWSLLESILTNGSPEAWQATVTCNTVFSSNLTATGPRLHQSGVRTQAPVAIRPIMALYKHSLGRCRGYRQSARNFVCHRNVVRNTILLIISVKKAAALIPPWLLTINCLDKVSDLFKVRFTRIVECHLCVDISRYQYQILY